MAINPIDGGLWGAERFAIDYVQLMPDGRLYDGAVASIDGKSQDTVIAVREAW